MFDWITIKGLLFLDGLAICGLVWVLYSKLRAVIVGDNKVLDAKLDRLLENQGKIVAFLNKN